jgi:hypothetical protein
MQAQLNPVRLLNDIQTRDEAEEKSVRQPERIGLII